MLTDNLHRSRLKVDDLRVTPACAAKVISELLHEECQVPRKYIDEEMLEKRFKDRPTYLTQLWKTAARKAEVPVPCTSVHGIPLPRGDGR